MYPDNQQEMDEWMNKLQQVIDKLRNGQPKTNGTTPTTDGNNNIQQSTTNPTTNPTGSNPTIGADPGSTPVKPEDQKPLENGAGGIKGPREKLAVAKSEVPFLQNPESKVLEFWQIWSESIPPRDEIQPGSKIEFDVATAADMQKLTWRVSGPQNIFIQKMVDFFWNVGAPESEIDRLNDVGALINPVTIGSWIDMSQKGGMDGGWFFPVDIPLKYTIEASDAGEPTKKVAEWAEHHGVVDCYQVGRDMGAAPPRQTEIRFKVPGTTFNEQLDHALTSYEAFGFPPLPEDAITIIRASPKEGLAMSVITSSDGFVRLGLLTPKPDAGTVEKLCSLSGAPNSELLAKFESSLGVNGPEYAEYQYLMKGFGYGVYKEGFDVVFHYKVGEELSK